VDHDTETYTGEFAGVYDAWFGQLQDPKPVVARLAGLAGDGPVLELGIGTGRVALPLREQGVDVHGIDASVAMVDQLRVKPGGRAVPITLGDFRDVAVEGTFSLIYAAAGTFAELSDQDAQVRCFENVARHLKPGGRFVFDALLPEISRAGGLSSVQLVPSADEQTIVQFRQFDLVSQRYTSHYLIFSDGAVRRMRVQFRYAWPAELDLMARIAGLRLVERIGTWAGAPFTNASAYHVSVYELPS
jgi:SAM-dependent methyltransferase